MNPGIDAVAGRVLVVDDEKPLAQMIATYLTRAGYDVATAHTGPEAVEAARAQAPDVVVLDLGLPGLDGIEVCRRIRGFSECYVLMLTARPHQALTRRQLIDTVWGPAWVGDERIVDVHIGHLRRKLGEDKATFIDTVRGVGYRMVTR